MEWFAFFGGLWRKLRTSTKSRILRIRLLGFEFSGNKTSAQWLLKLGLVTQHLYCELTHALGLCHNNIPAYLHLVTAHGSSFLGEVYVLDTALGSGQVFVDVGQVVDGRFRRF